jgi:predicted RNA binding protein YcfA (HicA-like mRNA interferase family)
MRPVSRQELIRRLRRLGFESPFSGGRHSFMRRGPLKLRIPNPHEGDISPALLKELLRQAGITKDEWSDGE